MVLQIESFITSDCSAVTAILSLSLTLLLYFTESYTIFYQSYSTDIY